MYIYSNYDVEIELMPYYWSHPMENLRLGFEIFENDCIQYFNLGKIYSPINTKSMTTHLISHSFDHRFDHYVKWSHCLHEHIPKKIKAILFSYKNTRFAAATWFLYALAFGVAMQFTLASGATLDVGD